RASCAGRLVARDDRGAGQPGCAEVRWGGAGGGVAAGTARIISGCVRGGVCRRGLRSRQPGQAAILAGETMTHILKTAELFLAQVPLVRPFTTSSHTKSHLDHILIRVRDQDGAEGWGECASASDPYYCSETSETSWHILRDFLLPSVLGVAWNHPDEAANT